MRCPAALFALAGCNQVFGIDETVPLDAFVAPVTPCFRDDFEDGTIDSTRWTEINPGGLPTYTEQGGALNAPIAMGQVGYNGYVSVPFDMVDGTLSVHITPGYMAGFTDVEFVLDASALEKFIVTIGVNQLNLSYEVNNLNSGATRIPYTTDMAHIRFRHEASAKLMHAETSPDGMQWTLRGTGPTPYTPTAAQLTLLVGSYEGPNMSFVPESSVVTYDAIRHSAPSCED